MTVTKMQVHGGAGVRRGWELVSRYLVPAVCTIVAFSTEAWAEPISRRLDVSQCVALALQQNLALQSVKLGIDIADADIVVAESYQDSRVGLQGLHEDSELPSSNVPSQGATTTTLLGGEFGRRLDSGTEVGLNASSVRLKFSDAQAPLEPLYISQLRLNARQSLLRNRFGRQDRAVVEVAEQGRDLALQAYYHQRERIALQVHEAYWQAYTASNLFLVNQRALERARLLLEKNRAYFEDGLIDETGILAAEARLAEREVDVLNLNNSAIAQLDLLKEQLNLRVDQWGRTVIVFPSVQEMALQQSPTVTDVSQALEVARASRPDIAGLLAEAGQLRAQLRATGDAEKSDLAVFGEVGVGDFAESLSDSLSTDRQVWSAGLAWQSAPQGSAREAERRKVRLGLERNLLQLQELEQAVIRELRRAIRNLNVAHERVRATRKARELQQRKLDREEEKFGQGRSTTQVVIEYQDDLSFAEWAEIRALAELHLAEVRYDFSRGVLVSSESAP